MTRYLLILVLLSGCGAETPDIDARGVCRSELLRPEPYPKGHACYIAPSDDNDGLTHDTAWETIGGPHPNAGNERAPRYIGTGGNDQADGLSGHNERRQSNESL